jgi:hypothetical protein
MDGPGVPGCKTTSRTVTRWLSITGAAAKAGVAQTGVVKAAKAQNRTFRIEFFLRILPEL